MTSLARGQTTPASNTGSFRPTTGRRSRTSIGNDEQWEAIAGIIAMRVPAAARRHGVDPDEVASDTNANVATHVARHPEWMQDGLDKNQYLTIVVNNAAAAVAKQQRKQRMLAAKLRMQHLAEVHAGAGEVDLDDRDDQEAVPPRLRWALIADTFDVPTVNAESYTEDVAIAVRRQMTELGDVPAAIAAWRAETLDAAGERTLFYPWGARPAYKKIAFDEWTPPSFDEQRDLVDAFARMGAAAPAAWQSAVSAGIRYPQSRPKPDYLKAGASRG